MARPHRVVFVLPSFAGGGAERVLLALLGSLDPSKFDVRLVVFDDKGPLVHDVPRGVPVVGLHQRRFRQALPALIRHLRVEAADVIVSTFGYVNLGLLGLRLLLPSRTQIVVREANTPLATVEAVSFPRLARLGYRYLYRRAKAVLCPTNEILTALREACGTSAGRLILLPNPVDEDRLRRKARDPKRHPGSGLRFVAAGRFTRQKGFDRLLETFASLPDPSAHLTILGDGPDRSSIRALIEARGIADRVSLPGFVRDPWSYYSGADAFLLTSRWEGMPNVALEALAIGVPLIATPESGGVAELAAETEPGAVAIAEIGDPYIRALTRVHPRTPGLGPSLLPTRFNLGAVARQFAGILTD